MADPAAQPATKATPAAPKATPAGPTGSTSPPGPAGQPAGQPVRPPALPGSFRAALNRVDLKAILPIPALILAVGALGVGIAAAVRKAPKDDPAAPLIAVKEALDNGEFEVAIDTLNNKLIPPLQRGLLSEQATRDFFLSRAIALYAGQQKLGISRDDNNTAIVADYDAAVKAGAKLSPADTTNLASTLVALGDFDRAIAMAKAMPAAQWPSRAVIYRRIVDENLASADVKFDQTLGLIGQLFEAPGASIDDRGWALARQTELRLAMDYHEEAISRLLRTLPTLDGLSSVQRAELLYLLGKAYFEVGELDQATSTLAMAESELPSDSPSRAHASVMIGRVAQSRGQHEEAKERFVKVLAELGDSPAAPRALFGLAETLGTLGDDAQAVETFEQLIERMTAHPATPGPESREFNLRTVGDALLERQADRFTREEFDIALRYAMAADRAFKPIPVPLAPGHLENPAGHNSPAKAPHTSATATTPPAHHGPKTAPSAQDPDGLANPSESPMLGATNDGPPARLYLALGDSHRKVAERILKEARTTDAGFLAISQVSPVTAAEAKRHLLDAGAAFREHARLVAAREPVLSSASLWNAADCYDLAADKDSAREAFANYAQLASDNDPRKVEARFRMAQIFQSQRDVGTAAVIYRAIIDQRNAGADGGQSAGLTADKSLVPLARCLLSDNDPANDSQAEDLLRQVLSGSTFAPEAEQYRDALTELGEHYYATRRFAQAINSLDEAARRYPDAPRATIVAFKLADSMRSSATEIAQDLTGAMPQVRREELGLARRSRLKAAQDAYAAVAAAIAKQEPRRTTELDRVLQRNAVFYQADCAFELEDDATALRLYEQATQQYAAEPAALVARTQSVAIYLRQGRVAEAATENQRAKRHLASLPKAAFDDPNIPMSRAHWERWLNADTTIKQLTRTDPASPASPAPAPTAPATPPQANVPGNR